MMHVSVMMLSYAALMVGSLLAIAFLVVTRGKNIELRQFCWHWRYRQNGYRLHRPDSGSTPNSSAEQSAMARLIENNGNGKTAVLDVVTASHLKR